LQRALNEHILRASLALVQDLKEKHAPVLRKASR
jgi:hypothetical protein